MKGWKWKPAAGYPSLNLKDCGSSWIRLWFASGDRISDLPGQHVPKRDAFQHISSPFRVVLLVQVKTWWSDTKRKQHQIAKFAHALTWAHAKDHYQTRGRRLSQFCWEKVSESRAAYVCGSQFQHLQPSSTAIAVQVKIKHHISDTRKRYRCRFVDRWSSLILVGRGWVIQWLARVYGSERMKFVRPQSQRQRNSVTLTIEQWQFVFTVLPFVFEELFQPPPQENLELSQADQDQFHRLQTSSQNYCFLYLYIYFVFCMPVVVFKISLLEEASSVRKTLCGIGTYAALEQGGVEEADGRGYQTEIPQRNPVRSRTTCNSLFDSWILRFSV